MVAGSGHGYVSDRPIEALRVPNPWRPYAHYIAALTDALERSVRALSVQPGTSVLDFGCADRPYHDWFEPGVEVVGADLPGNPDASVQVREDGTLPVPDRSFDVVLSTQVLEHVPDPAGYLAECARVLRPGGRLLLSTHGVFYLHPDPVDYWRWTSDGLRKVVEDAGLRVTAVEGVFGMGALGLQLLVDAVTTKLARRLRPLAYRATHPLVAFVDRRQGADAKRLNASVFVVTAERAPAP